MDNCRYYNLKLKNYYVQIYAHIPEMCASVHFAEEDIWKRLGQGRFREFKKTII